MARMLVSELLSDLGEAQVLLENLESSWRCTYCHSDGYAYVCMDGFGVYLECANEGDGKPHTHKILSAERQDGRLAALVLGEKQYGSEGRADFPPRWVDVDTKIPVERQTGTRDLPFDCITRALMAPGTPGRMSLHLVHWDPEQWRAILRGLRIDPWVPERTESELLREVKLCGLRVQRAEQATHELYQRGFDARKILACARAHVEGETTADRLMRLERLIDSAHGALISPDPEPDGTDERGGPTWATNCQRCHTRYIPGAGDSNTLCTACASGTQVWSWSIQSDVTVWGWPSLERVMTLQLAIPKDAPKTRHNMARSFRALADALEGKP